MGSYGIGVSRAVAAVAEGTCDEKGLCWPRELAPFDVQMLATGKDDAVLRAAGRPGRGPGRGRSRRAAGRPKASPGVKFADAEIMGMPTIVVVGRGLAEGVIEVRDRRTGERTEVPVDDALGEIVAAVHGRPALD